MTQTEIANMRNKHEQYRTTEECTSR